MKRRGGLLNLKTVNVGRASALILTIVWSSSRRYRVPGSLLVGAASAVVAAKERAVVRTTHEVRW